MLSEYTTVYSQFNTYCLTDLDPYQALVVHAADDQRLFVRIDDHTGGGIVDGVICLASASIAMLNSLDPTPRQINNVGSLITVGRFWRYGPDHMSNRVRSIELLALSVL